MPFIRLLTSATTKGEVGTALGEEHLTYGPEDVGARLDREQVEVGVDADVVGAVPVAHAAVACVFPAQSLSVASGVKAAANASESPAFVASMNARIALGVSAGSMNFPSGSGGRELLALPAVRSLRYGQQVGKADPGQKLAADPIGDL